MVRSLKWKVFMIVLNLFLQRSHCIPIVKSLGCGDSDDRLSIDRRAYCCSHFNLNCGSGLSVKSESRQPLDASKLQTTFTYIVPGGGENENIVKTEKKNFRGNAVSSEHDHEERLTKFLKVINLGQNCESKWVRCGTGLECRLGICMRDKSSQHFRRLLAVGKEVENVEHMAASNGDQVAMDEDEKKEDADDEEGGDPLSLGDHIVIRGQSVDIGMGAELFNVHENVDVSKKENSKKGIENKAEIGLLDRAAVHGDEEDEMTANIADYLSAKGKKLSYKEWHTVRKLIAGTIDERAERDEEVEQVEAAEAAARLQHEMQKKTERTKSKTQCEA